MKKIIAMLCVLALMLGMVNTVAFAADADTAARIGAQSYSSLQAAVDAYDSGVITLEADAQDLTAAKDVYLDLNGYDIENVTVTGGTLYCMDSETDDYSVADGVYGKLTNVTGNVAGVSVEDGCAEDGYLMVAADEGVSFHRVKLQVYAMSLRADKVGVYYKSHFVGDEKVAENVQTFGVALSVKGIPTAENLESDCGYSWFEDFKAGEGSNAESATGTLLRGIMKTGNTEAENTSYAKMPVYGRPYIKTADGLMFGASVERSLKEQVEGVNNIWDGLLDSQKATILAMYETYASAMEGWNIPNIQGIQTPGGNGEIELPIYVAAENGVVTKEVTVSANGITITVPAGTKLAEGAESLKLIVTAKETSDAGLTLEESEVLMPMDVHVDGIAADNTAPLTISLGKVMPENLNMGNYTIYHVENGMANEMTLIAADQAFTAHNQYKYTLDGELTLYMATFSEVAVVSNEVNAWNGQMDTSWYDAGKSVLAIRNADQLAGFGAIVGGMAEGIEQDSFSGKTVNLLADINIGDLDSENGVVLYPVGYYNSEGTYEKSGNEITSGFKTFEGIFDGNGHTISNIYQNTWEMKGDHNWYTPEEQNYRDGMGLFGKVYGGTVKNLTVDNFSSDGEITTTGVIASYADCGATFENISIFNCNPRVYNIGNGGIVGVVGWYANDEHADPVTLTNITVDNSNKISALWGSWDVACGGLVGHYYPVSGQSNAIENKGIHMQNCHVAAQIDVNNDVCANYQYYWYRYSGMLIGTVDQTKEVNGQTVLDLTGITAENTTVNFGDWNDYYYCELVNNSLASYTHDHQFSRLTEVSSEEEMITTGTHHYVIVDRTGETKTAQCYHYINGQLHTHDLSGNETTDIDGDGNVDSDVPKEDKTLVNLPFNQVFGGYGWGVKGTQASELDGITVSGITEGTKVESSERFEGKGVTLVNPGVAYKVGELFAAIADDINDVAVQVAVTDPNGVVTAVYTANDEDWTQGTITFTGEGTVKITIQDYFYCTPTTYELTVGSMVDGGNSGKVPSVEEEDGDINIDLDFSFDINEEESGEE